MTNLTEKQANKCGYSIIEGSYYGTSDDVAGRWYVVKDMSVINKLGKGHTTKKDALQSLAEYLRE
jgi:hypothetical protein